MKKTYQNKAIKAPKNKTVKPKTAKPETPEEEPKVLYFDDE